MMRVRTYLGPSKIHGIGVFARDPINWGILVWAFDPFKDIVYPHNMQNIPLEPKMQKFMDTLKDYSCRKIHAGEELPVDYNLFDEGINFRPSQDTKPIDTKLFGPGSISIESNDRGSFYIKETKDGWYRSSALLYPTAGDAYHAARETIQWNPCWTKI
jgi:hypothetical protein